MALKISNGAYGTLASSITNSTTSIVMNTGDGARFPTFAVGDWGWATLSNSSNVLEVVKITARSADTLTVVRAQDGYSAASFAAGDRIDMRPCAAVMNDKLDAATAAATYATITSMNTGLGAKLDSATALTTYAALSGGNVLAGVQKIQAQQGTVVALGTVSGTVTIDLSAGQTYTATINGTTTFSFTNPPTSGRDLSIYLKLSNAGAYTVNWPAGTKYPQGAAPVFTAAGKDLVGVWYDVEQSAYVIGVLWKDYK